MDRPEKIRIGGIKFSQELVHVTICPSSSTDISHLNHLLQQLAEKTINIPFLCHSNTKHSSKTSFCVETNYLNEVVATDSFTAFPAKDVKIIPSVGTCTIFPHKYSFLFVSQILKVIETFNFPLYSLSTSISALALNTDFHLLDQLAEKLVTIMELPENHAPFRQEFVLKQLQQ